jgi:hypothetical protein
MELIMQEFITPITFKRTTSFIEYYDEMCEILKESPYVLSYFSQHNNDNLDNIAYNAEVAEKIKKDYKLIGIYNRFTLDNDIYFKQEENYINYTIIDKNSIMGQFEGKLIDDNLFKIIWIWNNKRSVHGLIREMFFKYFLPKYKIILSDDTVTQNGKIFFNKLLTECLTLNKECGIYNLTDKTFTKYTNYDELMKFWNIQNSTNYLFYFKN